MFALLIYRMYTNMEIFRSKDGFLSTRYFLYHCQFLCHKICQDITKTLRGTRLWRIRVRFVMTFIAGILVEISDIKKLAQ